MGVWGTCSGAPAVRSLQDGGQAPDSTGAKNGHAEVERAPHPARGEGQPGAMHRDPPQGCWHG